MFGNFRLFNHANKQGGKIEAYDPHHSIYLRKGYRNEHDELNLHEYGSINMFTGGLIQNQKKRMKIANNGNIELYNNLKINGQTDMGDTLNINGNIVFIPNADPGFDWIFSHNPSGLITAWGGANSHMAIRAAELQIPAVLGVGEVLYQKWLSTKRLYINCLTQKVEII